MFLQLLLVSWLVRMISSQSHHSLKKVLKEHARRLPQKISFMVDQNLPTFCSPKNWQENSNQVELFLIHCILVQFRPIFKSIPLEFYPFLLPFPHSFSRHHTKELKPHCL